MKNILFSGGGTLGHIMPNIVVANKLKTLGYNVCYVGEKNSMEENMCKINNINFYTIKAVKLDRYKKINNLKIPFILPVSICESNKIIKKINPSLVFTKGGYVSLPVVISSKMQNIPLICHESDSSLGIVNKIGYKLGATILTSKNCSFDKCIKVGIPLKESLFVKKNKILSSKPTILVTGGSQGAKSINDFFINNLDTILANYNLIIIGGKTLDLSLNKKGLTLIDFTTHIENYYSEADIVVARAGATTIAEILALNKKAILIPLPLSVSRGDQLQNAENVKCETIKVISQDKLDIKTFMKTLEKLQNTKQTENKFVNPLDEVVKIIEQKVNN